MRLLRLLGLSLTAIFTIGVFAAASASATEPGFLSLAGGFEKAVTLSAEGGEATLQTGAKKSITCLTVKTENGTFGNAAKVTHINLGTAILHFTGCKFNKIACSSENEKKEKDAKEIILVDVDFHLIDVLTAGGELEPGIAIILLEPLNTIGTIKLNCGGSILTIKGVAKGLLLVASLTEDITKGEIHFFAAGEKCDTSDKLCKELDEKPFLADVGKGNEVAEELALLKFTVGEKVLVDD